MFNLLLVTYCNSPDGRVVLKLDSEMLITCRQASFTALPTGPARVKNTSNNIIQPNVTLADLSIHGELTLHFKCG